MLLTCKQPDWSHCIKTRMHEEAHASTPASHAEREWDGSFAQTCFPEPPHGSWQPYVQVEISFVPVCL